MSVEGQPRFDNSLVPRYRCMFGDLGRFAGTSDPGLDVKGGMSMWRRLLVAGVVLSVAACGGVSASTEGSSSTAATSSAAPTAEDVAASASSETVNVPAVGHVPMCDEVSEPTAPEDWYADSPVYVGNEMPVEEVRQFASGLPGYENIWIDRSHNGWISVGFVDADVAAVQTALEEEFPGAGVVAVAMPYSYTQLDEIRRRISDALPEDMDASNMFETRGVVAVWVGRLTPERIAIAEQAIGDDPACLEGRDPATTPAPGPQQTEGDGWVYLAVVDSTMAERPTIAADANSLDQLWEHLGVAGTPPSVDFGTHIVVGFPVRYSGSCPETRFDDVVIDGDLVYPVISQLSTTQVCTADANPRTYLVAVERGRLPEPPFRITYQKGTVLEVQVTADLRPPGSIPAEGELADVTGTLPRTATPTPLVIETGNPWTITIDLSCGIGYLGVINGVGWRIDDTTADDVPVEWEAAAVDDLLDVELLIEEGPEPSLTASAAGHDIVYKPGPDDGTPCN